jgi:hypothetical protein
MRPSDADLTSTALETDQQAADQVRCVHATAPDPATLRGEVTRVGVIATAALRASLRDDTHAARLTATGLLAYRYGSLTGNRCCEDRLSPGTKPWSMSKKSGQPEHLSVSLSGRPTVAEPIERITDDGKLIPPGDLIVMRPAIPEWEESAANYEELIDALGERDIHVELAEVKGIPSGADLPEFVPVAFSVYIGVKVTDALIGTIVDEAMRVVVARAKARWWRRGKKVKGVIYGPDGEILREIVFESKEGREESRRGNDR